MGKMPILGRNAKREGEAEKVDLTVIKDGIESISRILSSYMAEVEKRLETVEKMIVGLERRVDGFDIRIASIEKSVKELMEEAKPVMVSSALVEEIRERVATASAPSEAGGEEAYTQTHPTVGKRTVTEATGTAEKPASRVEEEKREEEKREEEEWRLVDEEAGFTTVVEEFKKLLGENEKKEKEG